MSRALETALLTAHAIVKARLPQLTEAEQFSFKLLVQPEVEKLPAYEQALNDERVANSLSLNDDLPHEAGHFYVETLQMQVRDLTQRLEEETVHYSTLTRERNFFQGDAIYWKNLCDKFEEDAKGNYLKAKFFEALNKGHGDYFKQVPRGMNPYPTLEGEEATAAFYWNVGWDNARETDELRKKLEAQELAYKHLNFAYGQLKDVFKDAVVQSNSRPTTDQEELDKFLALPIFEQMKQLPHKEVAFLEKLNSVSSLSPVLRSSVQGQLTLYSHP